MNSTFNHGKEGGKRLSSSSLKKDTAPKQKLNTPEEEFFQEDGSLFKNSAALEQNISNSEKTIQQKSIEEEDLFLGDDLLDMGFWEEEFYEDQDEDDLF